MKCISTLLLTLLFNHITRDAGYGLPDPLVAGDEAEAFYNYLGSVGFKQVFHFGNSLAWESDFEYNPSYPELVEYLDITYFCGHGSPNVFWFGVNHDRNGILPYRAHSNDCYWGRKTLSG